MLDLTRHRCSPNRTCNAPRVKDGSTISALPQMVIFKRQFRGTTNSPKSPDDPRQISSPEKPSVPGYPGIAMNHRHTPTSSKINTSTRFSRQSDRSARQYAEVLPVTTSIRKKLERVSNTFQYSHILLMQLFSLPDVINEIESLSLHELDA